ncbi:MAG: cysteine desulfurase, partial [Salibacteraceae bacterium]
LDIEGVCVSGGSACSSGSSIGSHVTSALQIPSNRPVVRFSFSKFNTKEEIDITIDKLKSIYKLPAIA